MKKPHKGSLHNWELIKTDRSIDGLIMYTIGTFIDHPIFAGKKGHTSMIKSIEFKDGKAEIETMNSRYTLV